MGSESTTDAHGNPRIRLAVLAERMKRATMALETCRADITDMRLAFERTAAGMEALLDRCHERGEAIRKASDDAIEAITLAKEAKAMAGAKPKGHTAAWITVYGSVLTALIAGIFLLLTAGCAREAQTAATTTATIAGTYAGQPVQLQMAMDTEAQQRAVLRPDIQGIAQAVGTGAKASGIPWLEIAGGAVLALAGTGGAVALRKRKNIRRGNNDPIS